MLALLPPSLSSPQVMAHSYPRYLIPIVNRHEEFYALLMLVVERYHLKNHRESLVPLLARAQPSSTKLTSSPSPCPKTPPSLSTSTVSEDVEYHLSKLLAEMLSKEDPRLVPV